MSGFPNNTGSRLIGEVHADNTISNNNTRQALATIPLPANLQPGNRMIVRANIEVTNNSAGSVNYTFDVGLGGSTITVQAATGFVQSANKRLIQIQVIIVVKTTGTESWYSQLMNTAASASFPVGANQNLLNQGTASEDLTVSPNLTVNVTMGTADPAASATLHSASVELLAP